MTQVAGVGRTYIHKAKRVRLAGLGDEVLAGTVTLEAADTSLKQVDGDTTTYQRGRPPYQDRRLVQDRDRLAKELRDLEEEVTRERERWAREMEAREARIRDLEGLNQELKNSLADLAAENTRLKEEVSTVPRKKPPMTASPSDQFPMFTD